MSPERDVALVASDLDGTLLMPPDHTKVDGREVRADLGRISDRTRAALDALRARAVDVVAVTGRPPRWVTGLDLGGGLAICSNGALVIDLSDGSVVAEHVLAPEVSAEIVDRLRRLHPDGMMAVEFADGVGLEQAWRDMVARADVGTVAPAEELIERAAAKILMRVPGQRGDAFIDAAAEAIGDLATVTASGGLQLIEVSARGVDKASTLATLCAERSIGAPGVVAFGDARNDLPMLTWAGTGVAMGDAHPSVIAAADDVTGTNADDGVAAWLERHVL